MQWAKAGLLDNSRSLILATLARDTFEGPALRSVKTKSYRDQKARALGILAYLGLCYQKGALSLNTVLRILFNPEHIDDRLSYNANFWRMKSQTDAVAIPLNYSTQLAYNVLCSHPEWREHEQKRLDTVINPKGDVKVDVGLSRVETRNSLWSMSEPFVVDNILARAVRTVQKLNILRADWPNAVINRTVFPLYYVDTGEPAPLNELPLRYQMNWERWKLFILREWPLPKDLTLLATSRIFDPSLTMKEAEEILSEIESELQGYEIPEAAPAPKTTIMETAKVLSNLAHRARITDPFVPQSTFLNAEEDLLNPPIPVEELEVPEAFLNPQEYLAESPIHLLLISRQRSGIT